MRSPDNAHPAHHRPRHPVGAGVHRPAGPRGSRLPGGHPLVPRQPPAPPHVPRGDGFLVAGGGRGLLLGTPPGRPPQAGAGQPPRGATQPGVPRVRRPYDNGRLPRRPRLGPHHRRLRRHHPHRDHVRRDPLVALPPPPDRRRGNPAGRHGGPPRDARRHPDGPRPNRGRPPRGQRPHLRRRRRATPAPLPPPHFGGCHAPPRRVRSAPMLAPGSHARACPQPRSPWWILPACATAAIGLAVLLALLFLHDHPAAAQTPPTTPQPPISPPSVSPPAISPPSVSPPSVSPPSVSPPSVSPPSVSPPSVSSLPVSPPSLSPPPLPPAVSVVTPAVRPIAPAPAVNPPPPIEPPVGNPEAAPPPVREATAPPTQDIASPQLPQTPAPPA